MQIAKINAAFAGFSSVAALSGLTLGLTLLGTALALSIAPAVRFEQAFTGVTKTVEGTPAQLDSIRTGILDMSRTMPFAATEIAKVAQAAGQLGVETPDILEFTRTMVQLGVATDLTAEQAAMSMARFANILEIPTSKIPLMAAALVHLGNNSATTESEILTLGLRLAAAGDQLGLSGQQVLALSAAMRGLGITAEVGGSSMSRVIIDMVSAVGGGNTAKVEAFARLVGVTRQEFETMVRDRSPESAGKLILGFVEGLQKIDAEGGNVRGALNELGLDSIRLRQVILGLVAGGSQLADAFKLVSDESVYGGALLTEYGRFAETTASRLEILKNRLTGLAIDIGTPALGGIVTILDGIGDAIVSMQDSFRPLGSELIELFGNLAEAIGIVYRALGSPLVLTAAAALTGLASTVSGLLSIFNAFGSTGILILGLLLADIALVGPLSVLATSGLRGLAAGFLSMGASASIGAAAIDLFKTALLASPLIIFIAGLAAFGKAMHDASKAAEAAGDAYRRSFKEAIENSDYDQVKRSIAEIRQELVQLQRVNSLEGPGDLLSWTGFKQAVVGVIEVMSPLEDTVLDARQRMNELNDVLDENQADWLAINIENLARALGVSERAAFSAAIATGTLDDIIQGGAQGYLIAKTAATGYLAALEATGLTAARSAEEIAETGLAIEDFAALWGASAGTIEAAAQRAGISMEDLLDEQKFQENISLMEPYVGLWAEIADAIGSTTDQVYREIAATEALIAAQSDLAQALDEVGKAREAAKFQVENLEAAAAAVAKAKEEYQAGTISLEEYAKQVGNLNAALAASGGPMEAVSAAQSALVNDFVSTAAAAGELQGAINAVLVDWVLLSTTEAANLELKGQETLAFAQERIANLRQELRLPIIAQMAVETGRSEEQIIALLDRGNTWANALFEAKMEAEVETALEQIARIMVEAGIWDQTQADAILGADISQAEAGITTTKTLAEQYAAGDYNASINASDNASAVIAVPQGAATTFKDGLYEGSITARDNASAVIAIPQSNADKYRAGDYNASITASDNASSSIAVPQGAANAYRDKSPYGIILTANVAGAVAAIGVAVNALASFQSKSITVTTNSVTNYSTTGTRPTASTSRFGAANGAVLRSYAGGGIENHTAMIANGAWPVRIWAEPETQGEAYIPLAQSKRPRSLGILADVADRFGYGLMPMANGGVNQAVLQSVLAGAGWRGGGSNWSRSVEHTYSISTPVQVVLENAGGMDPQVIGAEVERRVRSAMAGVARDIGNNIRGG